MGGNHGHVQRTPGPQVGWDGQWSLRTSIVDHQTPVRTIRVLTTMGTCNRPGRPIHTRLLMVVVPRTPDRVDYRDKNLFEVVRK